MAQTRHSLTSLRLFVAVAECGNVTRAAEREHLAVSAISKRMSDLEATVGVALLLRKPRGVALTPAGQSLLQYARRILQLVQSLDAELGEQAAGLKGHVRLHAVASAFAEFLPGEIERFLADHPLVDIELVEQTSEAVVAAVASGEADLGVVSSLVAAARLEVHPYHADRLSVGVPPGHPLAARASLRFAELAPYPFIGPHRNSSLSLLLDKASRDGKVWLNRRVQASSFDTMCRLVETRLGVTVLPDDVLASYAEAGRIGRVRLDEPWALRHFQLIGPDAELSSPIARRLLRHLRREAQQAGAAPA